MPAVTRQMCCPGPCGQTYGRATVRRHGRYGCPGQDREQVRLLCAVNHALNPAAEKPPELPRHRRRRRRHYHRRDPPVPPDPQRHPRVLPPQPQPAPDARREPDRDGDIPMCPPNPGLDAEDARLRHPDFAHDTAGAGPSGHAALPGFAPPIPDRLADTPIVTLADADEPWLRGLSAEDIIRQEVQAEIAREGGHHLLEDDMLTVQAFNYKVTTDITGRAFEQLPRAFPTRLGDLPSEDRIRSRAASLAGIQGVRFDCCINSCIAFTGPSEAFNECPHCAEPRHKRDPRTGKLKPRRVFIYIPLTPRLRNMYLNPKTARKMRYCAERRACAGKMADIFDGAHYDGLCQENVTVGGESLGHKFFSAPTDVALGLSTDGFGPFKSRKQSCWPIIVFNYNLPPSIRFKLENILCLGVIPGPHSPKELDTFLEPLIAELEDLARGVPAFDGDQKHPFCLRAFLLACFGDMPAIAKMMCMKGPNGKSPCRACHILGVRKGDGKGNTTNYVPLSRPWRADRTEPRQYDPRNLPLRTHNEFIRQAVHVGEADTHAEEKRHARATGINNLTPLARLSSLSFPLSFPHDFMHGLFENIVSGLIDIWTRTGRYEDHGDGDEDYRLAKSVWEGIAAACAKAGDTIPSAFRSRVPNFATSRTEATAESYLLFATLLGPAVLRNRFRRPVFYQHFVRLVQLINLCLALEIDEDDIDRIREGFVKWVLDYEHLYYMHERDCIHVCTLPIHSLLHIADEIEGLGPVWCYWAFPMERFCGALACANKSRRFPYSSLNRHVIHVAQLAQIKLIYGLAEELNLDKRKTDVATGSRYEGYPNLVFVRARRVKTLHRTVINKVANHLALLFGLEERVVRDALDGRQFETWARMQQTEPAKPWRQAGQGEETGGDLIRARAYLENSEQGGRDASYVKFQTWYNRWRWDRTRPRILGENDGQTNGYGWVEEFIIIDVEFLQELYGLADASIPPLHPIALAAIAPIPNLRRHADSGLIEYKLTSGKLGSIEIVNVRDIECLVGRITTPTNASYIVDRTTVVGRLDMLDIIPDLK
ncbi:hypothetical protein FRC06_003777 [Ceratobasidium sp. 370]|nr:hypothetical protein FRC06_003777 [Ceratobasidium sp. 370]